MLTSWVVREESCESNRGKSMFIGLLDFIPYLFAGRWVWVAMELWCFDCFGFAWG